MTRSRWTLAAAVVALLGFLALGVWWAVGSRPVADGYTGHAASPTPVASPSATPGTGATSEPGRSPSGRASTDGAEVPGAGTPATAAAQGHPSWDPAAEASEGADAQPKVPGGLGASPYRLPDPAERSPVLTAMPPSGHAEHALAEGFPVQAVPVPAGVQVQESSVEHQGTRAVLGLRALGTDTPDALLAFYTAHCEEQAWPAQRETAPDGSAVLTCGTADQRLTVSVSTLATGRTAVTATGTFRVED